jgi:hypothetical protein
VGWFEGSGMYLESRFARGWTVGPGHDGDVVGFCSSETRWESNVLFDDALEKSWMMDLRLWSKCLQRPALRFSLLR